MLEIFLMVILLPVSLLFNVILIFRGIAFVKTNEQLSDKIKSFDAEQEQTMRALSNMLNEMKEIDLKGSFESDDEVGAVFTQLKDTIESYKNQI